LILPTIHMNGTPRAQIQEPLETAYRAMTDAINAVIETAPNARDYYPQGPTAFPQAATEHERRLAALRAVQEELLALYEALDN
jgi:hypothetical protein